MFQWFYRLPLSYVIVATVFVIFLWSFLQHKYISRGYGSGIKTVCYWKLLNIALLTFSLFVIVNFTLLSRDAGMHDLILQPFYSFEVAKIQPEMYRSLLMNIVLFVPFGMSFSCLLNEHRTILFRMIFTSLLACLISLLIEATQYYYNLGEAWTDDVICNTIGAFIGSLTIVVWKLYYLRKNNYT